jgi:hypothetical protein
MVQISCSNKEEDSPELWLFRITGVLLVEPLEDNYKARLQ